MGYLHYENFNSTQPAEYHDYENTEVEWSLPDRYEIISKIGRGKYSEVFKGFDTQTSRFVVIKVLKPVKKKKIKREIRILDIVSGGPNVVRLVDKVMDPQSKTPALIFEFLENMDFRELFPKLTDFEVRYYMLSLLHALNFCHSKGIIHRDVKPHNVIINPWERKLRLIDWGLAEFFHPGVELNVRVASRYFKGPELLVDHRIYNYNLDMWSLGCMFAGIIFMKEPFFRGENNIDQLVKIIKVLGTDRFWQYIAKYNITVPKEFNGLIRPSVQRPWASFVNAENRQLCPPDAIEFLDRLLQYDMADRIQAKDAIDHPYFDPVRAAVAESGF